MFLPYNVDVPMERLPYANWGLLAVTLVLSFMAMFSSRPIITDPRIWAEDDPQVAEQQLRQLKEGKQPPPTALQRGPKFKIYQLFTHVLVNGEFFVLLTNLIFLFCFGNAINAKLGHMMFLVLFFLMGAISGLIWLWLGKGPMLVSSAGAVMGLTGVFLVFFPWNAVQVFFVGYGGLRTFELMSLWFVISEMILDLIETMINEDGGITGYLCHLGAELFGVAVSIALLLTGLIRSTEYELNILQVLGLQANPRDSRKQADRRSLSRKR